MSWVLVTIGKSLVVCLLIPCIYIHILWHVYISFIGWSKPVKPTILIYNHSGCYNRNIIGTFPTICIHIIYMYILGMRSDVMGVCIENAGIVAQGTHKRQERRRPLPRALLPPTSSSRWETVGKPWENVGEKCGNTQTWAWLLACSLAA